MFTTKEAKQLITKIGRRWLFPDFTNRITWLIATAGVAVILAPGPLKYILYNWLVETININSGEKFTLAEVMSDSAGYGIGLVLIALALAHNIAYRFIKYREASGKEVLSEQKRKSDLGLFGEFINSFSSKSDSLNLLRDHDFSNSFNNSSTDQIDSFINYWDVAEKTFHDVEIEGKKKELYDACAKFSRQLSEDAGSIGTGGRMSAVPDNYLGDDWNWPEFVINRIKKLNGLASDCYKTHQEFVTLCKTRLGC